MNEQNKYVKFIMYLEEDYLKDMIIYAACICMYII